MTEVLEISLKRAELSVRRFNEIAVPHHLGLLKNHRNEIEKCLALSDWTKIKKEEINALRVIKQLKNLLIEMEMLRRKIHCDDLNKFDIMIAEGRKHTLAAIKDFMDLQLKTPSWTNPGFRSPDDLDPEIIDSLPRIQTEYHENQLRARQACLDEFENLHREVKDLHEIFQNVSEIVLEQSEQVDVVTENAEEALENVIQGNLNLSQTLKYKKAFYPVMGAFLGTCVGGPIGLVAGLKAGGLAAIGCGILGFTGGSILKIGNNEIMAGIEEKTE